MRETLSPLQEGKLRSREGQALDYVVAGGCERRTESAAFGPVSPGSSLVPGSLSQERASHEPRQTAICAGLAQPGAVRSRF